MNNKKINFCTFANTAYMSGDRICNQAREMNIFDKIYQTNEYDIKDYIKKHSSFIKNNPAGFGLYIWKAKVIYDTLNKINMNDILIYCDAGVYLNKNGRERLDYYLKTLENDLYDIVTFSTSDKYIAQHYVKNDAIMSYYPEFNNQWNTCCYAGILIIKKTERVMKLINDWLNLCENYHFIDKTPSNKYKDLPHYKGNDCDNGLFNLCLAKYKINHTIQHTETNLYSDNGLQIHHTRAYSSMRDRSNIDWSKLDNYPFQCRRMTPKFGFKGQ
jgi:hypothetical protein